MEWWVDVWSKQLRMEAAKSTEDNSKDKKMKMCA